jgi:phage gp46-like protein
MAMITNTPWKCDPTPTRCVRPVEVTFKPGIAVKQTPSCTDGVCGLLQCNGGNWRVTAAGTLDRSEWIKGWVISQLFTRGEVSCIENPLKKRDGGWWADSFRTAGTISSFKSGSKLWALEFQSGGSPNQLLVRCKQYAQDALRFLLSWGIAKQIKVDVSFAGRTAFGWIIRLAITIYGPGVASSFTLEGQQQPSSEWLWREYRPENNRGATTWR